MKRLYGIIAVLGLAVLAASMGSFAKPFHEKYGVKPDSKLGKAGCALCHVSAKNLKLTPYGADMQKAMREAKTKRLTPAILESIEKLDSNKNGKSNLEDIKADTLP